MKTVFFDIETDSVNIATAQIVQLAAVAMDGDSELGTFDRLVKFDVSKADPKALEMNHYDADRWAKGAKSAADVLDDFSQWARPFCDQSRTSKAGRPYKVGTLCGYNAARFDFPILQRYGAIHGWFCPFDMRVRDAMLVALSMCDFMGVTPTDFKLGTMAEQFGVPVVKAHDALSDVRTTIGLMQRFRGFFQAKENS